MRKVHPNITFHYKLIYEIGESKEQVNLTAKADNKCRKVPPALFIFVDVNIYIAIAV